MKVFASYILDERIRLQSSSGGIFTLISNIIFDRNGVVYGAAYNKDFMVRHICIEEKNDLRELRGAKYSQSKLGDSFKHIKVQLDNGIIVLFSGTPCQVGALKNYLKQDYDNLICIDFVCHGVPLASVWQSYVKYRSETDNSGRLPVRINLRSKHSGWSSYNYSNLYEYDDGKTYSALSSEDLYMKLFTGDYINMKACSNCKFKGYSRTSDITLGDFWGIWDIAPEMDDNKGTSLVIIQSEKGEALWKQIQPKIKWKEMTQEEASRYNPSILYSSPAKPDRDKIVQLCLEGKWNEVEQLLLKPIVPNNVTLLKSRIKHIIKKVIG